MHHHIISQALPLSGEQSSHNRPLPHSVAPSLTLSLSLLDSGFLSLLPSAIDYIYGAEQEQHTHIWPTYSQSCNSPRWRDCGRSLCSCFYPILYYLFKDFLSFILPVFSLSTFLPLSLLYVASVELPLMLLFKLQVIQFDISKFKNL